MMLTQKTSSLILFTSRRFVRGPFGGPHKRTFEERNRSFLNQHKSKGLQLAEPAGRPDQWKIKPPQTQTIVPPKERKLPSLKEAASPYHRYTQEDIEGAQSHGTWYDPSFNPHLHEEGNRVNPDEEPFNAIYSDSKSEAANEYTKVKIITTPELWDYVERLARIKIAPLITRKANEPITRLPSGLVPAPETPPDLPYFVPRTRNQLLPVYYHLDKDPENCYTIVRQVTGDLWKLEEDLRIYLESLNGSERKILTSVQETDERILFRGRHIHQVVDWLHSKGF